MAGRVIVVEVATGVLRRQLRVRPADLAGNLRPGEIAFLLIDDDGRVIDDGNVVISESGEWAVRDGVPGGVTLPTLALEYIPLS